MADTDSWIRFSDLTLATCTLLGPVLAVQAQKWVERFREKRTRRLVTFRTLMTTRATVLNPAHVEALNSVPIDFYKNRPVMDAWEEYLRHLSAREIPVEVWGPKRIELLGTLLMKIAECVGYHFNMAQMHTLYFPTAHETADQEWEAIRKGAAALFKGEATLPLSIKDVPSDPKVAETQTLLFQRLAKAYTDSGASLRVSIADGELPQPHAKPSPGVGRFDDSGVAGFHRWRDGNRPT